MTRIWRQIEDQSDSQSGGRRRAVATCEALRDPRVPRLVLLALFRDAHRQVKREDPGTRD